MYAGSLGNQGTIFVIRLVNKRCLTGQNQYFEYFWFAYDLDKSTTPPKFDPTGVQTHDFQFMANTVQFLRCSPYPLSPYQGPFELSIMHDDQYIPVHKSIFQQRCHGIDIILAHLPNVLKHEAQGLKHAVLNVQLRHTVLVHEAGENSEGGACLCYDGDCHGCAHTVLTLLHLQVVEEGGQHIMWTVTTENNTSLALY